MDAKQISLSGWRYGNWGADSDGKPPVVLNPNASLRACIAWCWGEVHEAHELALAGIRHVELDGIDALEIIQSRLMGAEAMLEHMADKTLADQRRAA